MNDSEKLSDFFDHVLSLSETKLGIPQHIIKGLIHEDDWSFIIKLNALVEHITNHLLCSDISEGYLVDHIASLSLDKKIHLAKSKGVIDELIVGKFKFISKLRNQAAHNVIFKFFNTPELESEYRGKFKNTWFDMTLKSGQPISGVKFMQENPKVTLYFDCIGCLALMSVNHQRIILDREIDEFRAKVSEQKELVTGLFKKPSALE